MKKLINKAWLVLLSVMIFSGLFFTPQSVAVAAPPAQRNVSAILKNAYLVEQNWLLRQSNAIEKSIASAKNLQTVINDAAAKGIDVTALQAALDAFNNSMPDIQASHQQAADILAAHNGFDSNGEVTDATSARETLVSARQSLSEAHFALTNAVLTLKNAILTWKSTNNIQ